MKIAGISIAGVLAALVGIMITGCGEKDEHGSHDGHGDGSKHEGSEYGTESHETHDPDEDQPHIEGLAGKDLKLAQAQKVCPVSDQKLGSMGTPIRVEHDGKVVFLCCKMCKPKFENDPDTYLAKLENK